MVKLKSCGLRNPDTHLIPGVFHWVNQHPPPNVRMYHVHAHEMYEYANRNVYGCWQIHTCIPELFKIFCENFNIVHCGINNGIQ